MVSFIPRGTRGALTALVASSCFFPAASLHAVPPPGDASAASNESNESRWFSADSATQHELRCKCNATPAKAIARNLIRNRAPSRSVRNKTILVTVSVGMAGKLRASLRCNKPLLERIIVITSEKDRKTQRVCREEKVECHVTGAMYEHGDAFNKGRAIRQVQSELLQTPANRGSLLLFVDADICLPSTTWSHLPSRPQRGVIYTSTSRCLYDTPERYTAGVKASQRYYSALTLGMFQAYRLEPGAPLYSEGFPTAARSDNMFSRAFRNITKLDLWVSHLGGEVNRNWTGFVGDADRWDAATPPPDGACPCCYLPPAVLHHYA